MYFGTFDGFRPDELVGGHEIPVELWNINVAEGTEIERGMLLGASSAVANFAPISAENDASKVLVIAKDDFVADATHTVTTAYASGVFNREKIKLGGTSTLTLDAFIEPLRKSNIHIRSILSVT